MARIPDMAKRLDSIRMQNLDNLISTTPSPSRIRTEQPVLQQAELELITKFPPSVLFCFHGRLYFERCLRCKRTASEAKDNFVRFQNGVNDMS